MVTLYVADRKVGTIEDAGRVLAESLDRNHPVEFRDDSGNLLGTFIPRQEPTSPDPLVPWDPTITRDELERISAEPGFTFEEVKKQLGWE